ncbi:hypothetical protein B0H14DRAFT_3503032 [Mycena olivaceomarginata]|nr:hypothetical protein B0H14DRAFT_3503032 [Mycena olivaceomarginata]
MPSPLALSSVDAASIHAASLVIFHHTRLRFGARTRSPPPQSSLYQVFLTATPTSSSRRISNHSVEPDLSKTLWQRVSALETRVNAMEKESDERPQAATLLPHAISVFLRLSIHPDVPSKVYTWHDTPQEISQDNTVSRLLDDLAWEQLSKEHRVYTPCTLP